MSCPENSCNSLIANLSSKVLISNVTYEISLEYIMRFNFIPNSGILLCLGKIMVFFGVFLLFLLLFPGKYGRICEQFSSFLNFQFIPWISTNSALICSGTALSAQISTEYRFAIKNLVITLKIRAENSAKRL